MKTRLSSSRLICLLCLFSLVSVCPAETAYFFTSFRGNGAGHYGVYQTTNWHDWNNISNQTAVVAGQRHGSILAVSDALVQALRPSSLPSEPSRAAPAAVLPGRNADPHIAVFGDTCLRAR